MNSPSIYEYFSSKNFRTIATDAKSNPVSKFSYIPIEIELSEGSKIYESLPSFFDGDHVIYAYANVSDKLNTRFTPCTDGSYGNRYIIFRETANHVISLFVSDDESQMNFIKFEKKDFGEMLKNSLHPSM
ncbi:MAG: hypothetical protein ACI4ES_15650 [Roseburia sp.]